MSKLKRSPRVGCLSPKQSWKPRCFLSVSRWGWVKTLYPCSSHQNSWDLWMSIPLKMVLIGIDPYPGGTSPYTRGFSIFRFPIPEMVTKSVYPLKTWRVVWCILEIEQHKQFCRGTYCIWVSSQTGLDPEDDKSYKSSNSKHKASRPTFSAASTLLEVNPHDWIVEKTTHVQHQLFRIFITL